MYNNMIFPSLISQKHFFKFIIYLNSFKYIKYILKKKKKKTYMSSFKPLYSNTKNGNMVNMFEMHAIDGLN